MYIDLLKIKRIIATCIDFFLSMVLGIFFMILFPQNKFFMYISCYVFMLFKDVVGFSIGKHFMKLTIVDRNGAPPPLEGP